MSDRPTMVALYAPADRPERFGKALDAGADAVIVDLEDAVTASRKDEARAALDAFAEEWRSRASARPTVQVRVNAIGSRWHDDDLAAVGRLPAEFDVRLPKTQSAADVQAVSAAVPARRVHALIETPLAVERAYEIASSGAASIGAGEADLRSALGIPTGTAGEPGLLYSRSRLVNAAAAAELPPPLMAVWADVADLDGLEQSCRAGRALGYAGRTAVHPRQIDVIRRVFTPTPAEVERAQRIVDRVASAAADGSGAFVLDDGTFIDVAMLRGAERIVAAASRS
ncbi:CoA ester lyase [Microbacterium esteraromaticum]|uniref:CoA ester lyase n=1 Tax=Microbacterium esteraromaticum TaxID=57043 RepID=A0A7D8AJK4_9MICO|nr:CoA ester lyase [Microbacterium esteraromaticum]QMU97049.1 CoA ester lyase [Microbacterium esteraromaticum]